MYIPISTERLILFKTTKKEPWLKLVPSQHLTYLNIGLIHKNSNKETPGPQS